mmetsp:Transcript_1795/g.3898  ORF Transcript_1795/g.3898 Transcript_1795/m.3898 type:complete len:404 (-) Transcript_1795:125-1336(-)
MHRIKALNNLFRDGQKKDQGRVNVRYFLVPHHSDADLVYVYNITGIKDPTRGWKRNRGTPRYDAIRLDRTDTQKKFLVDWHKARMWQGNDLASFVDLSYETVDDCSDFFITWNSLHCASVDSMFVRRKELMEKMMQKLQQEQERRRLAETVEQARNVSQGAGAGVQAVAGDGASIQNRMYAFMLDQTERMAKLEVDQTERMAKLEVKTAEAFAEANLDQTERMAKLEVKTAEANLKQKEDIVETRGMINKSNVDISELELDISKLELGQERLQLGIAKNEVGQERLKLDIAKTDATANRAERKADKVNERVVLEDTVKKMTKSTAKRFPPKPVDDPLAHLTENASISPTHYGQAAAAAGKTNIKSFFQTHYPHYRSRLSLAQRWLVVGGVVWVERGLERGDLC